MPVSAWLYRVERPQPVKTCFIDLSEFKGIDNQAPRTLKAISNPLEPYRYLADCGEFLQIPGAPFAYAVSSKFRELFSGTAKLSDLVDFTGSQNVTGRNSRYVRLWWEVSSAKIGQDKRWVFYSKGGGSRKWWGLLEDVVDWSVQAREFYQQNKTSNLLDERYWFRPGVAYSMLTSNQATFRMFPPGAVYDKGGPAFHPQKDIDTHFLLGLCNSVFADRVFDVLNPTMNLQVQDVKNLPVPDCNRGALSQLTCQCVDLARQDWDSVETSWDFQHDLRASEVQSVREALQEARGQRLTRISQMRSLEEQVNTVVLTALDLTGELSAAVPEGRVTLYCSDQREDIARLVSYSIGCMMGRYSLDEPGLIYAHSGNNGFDFRQYKTFAPDQDGIIPVTETTWFDDDAANRLTEFVSVAWPKEHLEENLTFIAESLGPTKGEQPRETIRRYLAQEFFKDHLKTYRRRPIYWLFSSGKQRAFQCLVYLHRQNEGTLSRMRTEYVIPLQGKVSARIEQLAGDIAAATSTAFRSKLTKERDKLIKQQAELQAFDEKLRHYADLRITLDLDDGVRVNYGKFGDLLAEVKAVTGGNSDE